MRTSRAVFEFGLYVAGAVGLMVAFLTQINEGSLLQAYFKGSVAFYAVAFLAWLISMAARRWRKDSDQEAHDVSEQQRIDRLD